MKKSGLLILLLLTILGCKMDDRSSSNIYQYIPDQSSLVIKVNSLNNIEGALSNNLLLSELSKTAHLNSLKNALKSIDLLNTNDTCILAFSKGENDSIEYSLVTRNYKDLFQPDSSNNTSFETLRIDNNLITKIDYKNNHYYSAIRDSIFLISNSKKHLKTSLQVDQNQDKFQDLFKVSKTDKSASIYIDLNQSDFRPEILGSNTQNNTQFADFILIDVDLNQDDILFNGITKTKDSSNSLINAFKSTIPQENLIARVIPNNTDQYISVTADNFSMYCEQIKPSSAEDSLTVQSNYLETANEIGFVSFDVNKAIVLRSIDPEITFESLTQEMASTYRTIPIYNFEDEDLFEVYFDSFFTLEALSHYTRIEDYFIFSDQTETLERMISSFQNNATLFENSYYQNMMLQLSDESSLFVYGNPKGLNTTLGVNFENYEQLSLDRYQTSAIQFVYDGNFAHVNGILKTHSPNTNRNSVTEDFNVSLDADIYSSIQLLKNHRTNQYDIAIQDVDQTLYLISNQGKVYWKKQLKEYILGDIAQIDIYKNGRLQLVFATDSKVYVIDRNGKEVSPFPLKFNDKITQPLSVFDYDKKRKYRLMVTQGKDVLMYDQRGKIVSGFKYKSAKDVINSQPKHFRIGRKDYIVFADGNRMEILDRVGNRRVDVKEPIDFSNNEIYLYKNKFTTTNNSGELLAVDQKGTVNHTNLNLSEMHALTTTSKTLVTLSENTLRIRSNTIDLDFGDYTEPKIFYINDKIYVSVTDKQAKKVYLFDSQGKSISNFPVYGNSIIEMNNIDGDKALEVIVKGDNKSLIVYEMSPLF
ncbi:MAG: ribonuclease HII [Psychroserpens sp.]|nr:ribonuclease HII [Psychroserpens sp.]